MPKAIIQNIRQISTKDKYHGWATVARLQDGTLMVACSGDRQRHVCPFGKIQIMRSSDDGASWSEVETIADSPIDDRDAGIIQLPSGTIIVTWFTSLAWLRRVNLVEMGVRLPGYCGNTVDVWRAERDRLNKRGDVRELLGTFFIRSTDGGQTWSEPMRSMVSAPHGPTVTKSGRLIYAGKPHGEPINWERGASFSNQPVVIAASDDEGDSWEKLGEVPFAPGHGIPDYHEPHIIEADDGRLLVHIRSHGEPWGRDTLQSESTDGGKTWSTPRPLGVMGLPPHLMKLRDGRLLMTYGHRIPVYGIRAVISDDHGQTWSDAMTLSDDGADDDLGYPSTVELDDGDLLTVWYERYDLAINPNAVIRQARWSIEG